ncbi:TetR family transcriptional regulator [Spirosoma sp. HMF4905]|uniref:TetR family transcriptional regulator n=2 Tax=Spirosoma arboris TaxID=2682092 RepID=A0A7K1SC78_9BACT|nr:TetR family transcriptional regulator [Spirosoma arboris]
MAYLCVMKQRGQVVVDKILDTAERLFYAQGYSNTGINQVIEEADIAKASLYKHFDTKTDLLVAYIQRTHERWFNRIENAVNEVADPKDKLLALFDHHVERQEIRQFGGCPFIKANDEAGTSDPRVLAEIQLTKQHSKDFIKTLVVNSGHKKLLTDQELAELIFITLEGAIAAASVFKQPTELQSAKQIIQKLI